MACLYRDFSELSCEIGRLTQFEKPTRKRCSDCQWYEPSWLIIKHCGLFANTGEICLLPLTKCLTCPRYVTEGITLDQPLVTLTKNERNARYYLANMAREQERNREWIATNKSKRAEYMRAYMARRRAKAKTLRKGG